MGPPLCMWYVDWNVVMYDCTVLTSSSPTGNLKKWMLCAHVTDYPTLATFPIQNLLKECELEDNFGKRVSGSNCVLDRKSPWENSLKYEVVLTGPVSITCTQWPLLRANTLFPASLPWRNPPGHWQSQLCSKLDHEQERKDPSKRSFLWEPRLLGALWCLQGRI
jgi:hypothetical protein